MSATVRAIRRTPGAGGHVTYGVDVEAPVGLVRHFAFSGNVFVGPVVLVIDTGNGFSSEIVIDEPRQFGEFAAEEWVHQFFSEWQQLGYSTECFAQ